jgi:hypothetical protein
MHIITYPGHERKGYAGPIREIAWGSLKESVSETPLSRISPRDFRFSKIARLVCQLICENKERNAKNLARGRFHQLEVVSFSHVKI